MELNPSLGTSCCIIILAKCQHDIATQSMSMSFLPSSAFPSFLLHSLCSDPSAQSNHNCQMVLGQDFPQTSGSYPHSLLMTFYNFHFNECLYVSYRKLFFQYTPLITESFLSLCG